MTPDEALESIEQQFGKKPVRKPTTPEVIAAQKALDDIEDMFGKKYCKFCNTKNSVVNGECKECGAGTYLMPEAKL